MTYPFGTESSGLPGEVRGVRLQQALAELLTAAPDLEAAAVVSFDGLPMASALPVGMDEDRVAAMSAALLSLGEKAADGLGRGDLAQVYVEGEHGTVFLVSAADEAVLVAVASPRAKTGLMLWEVRHAAADIGALLADRRPLSTVTAFPAAAPPTPAAHAAPPPTPVPSVPDPFGDPLLGSPPLPPPVDPPYSVSPNLPGTFEPVAAEPVAAEPVASQPIGALDAAAATPTAGDPAEDWTATWSASDWVTPPRADDPWTP